MAFISEFNGQLSYLPGLTNVVADFLSRPAPQATGSVAATSAADPVDLEEMAAEQHRCPETQRLLGGTSLKIAFRQTGAQCLAGDVSTGTFRPIVPLKFRKAIFYHFHNVVHPPRLASPRIISFRFVWHGLSSDITAWACKSGLPSGQDPPPHTPGPQTHPHPTTAFFSPPCGFGGPIAIYCCNL
jgi:hypothetical protein